MVSNAMWAGGRLDPERRQELWKGSVRWTRRWSELQPGVPAQDVLLARCEEFGRLLVDQGAWEQAGEIATVAVTTAEDLVRLSKGKRFRRRLGGATTILAEVQIGKGEQLAAAESFGRADSIFAALPPDPALRRARVELLLSQSLVLHDLGRELEARHAIESGLELESTHWLARCRLAWLHATSLDSRVRDPAAALKHAMLAFEQRESAELLHTIGVALCAQGKPEKAVGVLRRCVKAGVDGPASVSLAWANALLGNEVVSRAELKRAERWHTKQGDADAFYLDTRRRVLAILADEEEGSRSKR
jgi:hypothetical protein